MGGRRNRRLWMAAGTVAAFVVVGTALTEGVLVGSAPAFRMRGNHEMAYFHTCKYLYFTGIRRVVTPAIVYDSQKEAEEQFCLPFDKRHNVDLSTVRAHEDPFEAIASGPQ
jgi:hypothetical protein